MLFYDSFCIYPCNKIKKIKKLKLSVSVHMLVKQISPRVSFVTSSRDLQYDAAEDTLWIT